MFKHQDLLMFDLKLKKLISFKPFEFQVGENLNKITKQDTG